MKKFVLFIMLALLCACNKEDDHICKIACPVTDVVVSTSDEDDPIRPGTTITIRGNGFIAESEIWIHPADVKTTIASYSATEIAFVVPEVSGEQNIVLKQGGLEWRLGKMYVAEEPASGETTDLSMTFERTEPIPCLPGKSVEIAYTLTGASNDTQLECIEENGWKAELHSTSSTAGYLRVTAPTPAEAGKVTVLLSNDLSNTLRYTLNFVGGFFEVKQSFYEISFSQQQIAVEIETNLPYSIGVPSEAMWITPPTDTEIAKGILKFSIAENTGITARRAKVDFLHESEVLQTIEIAQMSIPSGDIIKFADATLEAWLVQRYDTNSDGKLSHREAAAVTELATDLPRTITSFDEFCYFNGVTEIKDATFERCEQLQSITLPNSIASIGSLAFYECNKLKKIELPNTVREIGESAFYGCGITSILIPANVTEIKKTTFQNCYSLQSIDLPDGVSNIGERAFESCGIQSIVISDNVESIEAYTFAGCGNLREIKLSERLKSIGYRAFSHCKNLVSVDLPAGLSQLARGVFEYCINLTSITLPDNIQELPQDIFYECRGLKHVKLPDNLKTIEDGAFRGCILLKEVTIPAQVSNVYGSPFYGCSTLRRINCLPQNPPKDKLNYYLSIPDNVNIYVPAASVETYKTRSCWSKYADRIFPIEE